MCVKRWSSSQAHRIHTILVGTILELMTTTRLGPSHVVYLIWIHDIHYTELLDCTSVRSHRIAWFTVRVFINVCRCVLMGAIPNVFRNSCITVYKASPRMHNGVNLELAVNRSTRSRRRTSRGLLTHCTNIRCLQKKKWKVINVKAYQYLYKIECSRTRDYNHYVEWYNSSRPTKYHRNLTEKSSVYTYAKV